MANDERYPLLEPWVFPNEDEGEVPRTVLACAIEPCTNPAEIDVSIVGYGEYPPMVVRLCPSCANVFGKLLHDWPKPLPPPWLITTGISREELEQSLASHKDVITLSPPPTLTTHVDDAIAYAYNSLRDTHEEDIRRIEAHPASSPLFILDVSAEDFARLVGTPELLRASKSKTGARVELSRIPDWLRDRDPSLPEQRQTPEPERRKPGWLPGDE